MQLAKVEGDPFAQPPADIDNASVADLRPRAPAPSTAPKLVPVDTDPFAQTPVHAPKLVAVEGDPFGEQSAQPPPEGWRGPPMARIERFLPNYQPEEPGAPLTQWQPDERIGIGRRILEGAEAGTNPSSPLGISPENIQKYPALELLQIPARLADTPLRVLGAAFGGIGGGIGGLVEHFTGNPQWGDQAEAEFNTFITSKMGEAGAHIQARPLRRAAQSTPAEIESFLGTERGMRMRAEIDDFIARRDAAQAGTEGAPLALPAPEGVLRPSAPTAAAPVAPAPSAPAASTISPVERRVLLQDGLTDQQIGAMSPADVAVRMEDIANKGQIAPQDVTAPPREAPNDRANAPGLPGQVGDLGAQPVQAQPVQGGGGEAAGAGGVVQGSQTGQALPAPADQGVVSPAVPAQPPGRPVATPSLQDILNDPRSAAEIRGELEAARNWHPTEEWQDVPQGAALPPGLDIQTDPTTGAQRARLAPALGSREAPVRLETPADVTAGAEQTAQPTPAQAEVGNYAHRHLTWRGLDISIETEAGQQRTGLSPDGKPWSVTMPVPYGYLKRTVGKDGDHLDVYLGPQPQARQVFVVDQIDPDSLKFDEHKILAGFPDQATAAAAYEAAFSDGSGGMRTGAVTPMSVPEFKAWLASGETKKALAYAPPRAARAPAQRGPLSLFEFLASKGGIRDQGGELRTMDLQRVFIPGFGRLVRPGGKPLDMAREAAVEAGYLRDTPWEGGVSKTTIPDLLNLLDQEHRGQKAYSEGDLAEVARREADRQEKETARQLKEFEADVRKIAKDEGLHATDLEMRDAAKVALEQRIDPLDALVDILERNALAEERAGAETEAHGETHPTATDQNRAELAQAGQPARLEPKAAAGEAPAREQFGANQRDHGPARAAEPAATAIPSEPPKPAPAVERTPAGAQHALPGAEKIGQGELAQRKTDQPLKPKVAQKAADQGLFGDESRQTDLVDMARKPLEQKSAPADTAAVRHVREVAEQVKTVADAKEVGPDTALYSLRQGDLTPAAQQRRADIERMLSQVVARLVGTNVRVQFSDTIPLAAKAAGWGSHSEGVATAAGSYVPAETLIKLAMADHAYTGNKMQTAFHESFHAVEHQLLNDKEMALLAAETGRLRKFLNERVDGPSGQSKTWADDLAGYEVRAIAFEMYAYRRAEGKPIDGFHTGIARLFSRLMALLGRIRNALRGMGFKTAENIFSDVYEGKMAGRKPARGPNAQEPQYSLRRAPAEKAILDRIAPSDEAAGRKLSLNQLYTAIKDDLNPIRLLRNELADGKTLPAAKDPYVLARLTRGSYGKAQQFLEGGTFDFHTLKTTGKSFKEILSPVKKDLDGLRAYAVAKRSIELASRGIRTGVPLPEARATVTAGHSLYGPVFQELQTYQRSLTEYLHASGIIGDDGYAAMLSANKDYVPFFRLMGEGELGQGLGGGLKVKDPVKGIRGSDRKIIDPIESIIKNTFLFISLAERNRALVALADLADKSVHGNDLMPKVKVAVHPVNVTAQEINRFLRAEGIDAEASAALMIFRPNTFRPSKNEIALFRNGKREVRHVNEDVAEAVNALDRESSGLITKILSIPARTLRAGAVLSPEFIARNPVRDQFEAFINSEHGYVPVYDLARGLGALLTRGEAYQRWLKSGGANAALVSIDRDYINQNVIKLEHPGALNRVKNVIKSPLEALRVLSELTENATRIGEFMRASGKGKDAFEAGFASREVTLDFQRIGAQTRAVNKIIDFWNAQVEGTDRLARAFLKRPMTTLFKIAASITLPSILLWFANHDDDRFKELPRWERDLFWIIPTDKWEPFRVRDEGKMRDATDADVGNKSKRSYMRKRDGKWEINNGTLWRIPKPFAPGVVFGSIPERILDAYFDRSQEAFRKLAKTTLDAFLPNFIPQAAVPFLEHWGNRSFFLDRPLVPKYLEDIRAKYQAAPYTTETAQAIGKIIGKINDETSFGSPLVIENYVRSWTGSLGMSAMQIMDKVLTASGAVPAKVEPTKTLADIPVIRAFLARYPSAGAQSVEDFYDEWQKRKTNKATVRYLARTGEPEEAASEAADHPLATAEGIHKALGMQSKIIRDIYRDKTMKPDEKRSLIDQTYLQMIELAKAGNSVFKATEKRPAPAEAPSP